jgi:hypothetical protein
MEIDIIVPEGLHDIKLEQYQKFIALKSEDELFLSQKAVEIFCNVPLVLVDKMSYNDVRGISSRLFNYFNQKPELITKKKHGGKKFGFVPNLERITLGEFTDIDSNIKDWRNMHRVMAVLYRPIVNEVGRYYEIEEYDGTDKYADVMLSMPLDVVLGSLVFFYRLGIDLSRATTKYLQEATKTTSVQRRIFTENGDGTEAFMRSLAEALQSLKGLVDSPSIPH